MSADFVQIQPLYQPVDLGGAMATFSPEVEAEIDAHLAKYPVARSAILPLMFIVQRERGYLDPPGVAYLAKRLALRITDIWEVATFYSMIYTEPVGKYHIQVCRTLSCSAYIPYIPECIYDSPPPLVFNGSFPPGAVSRLWWK